jgi:hypothetical protein
MRVFFKLFPSAELVLETVESRFKVAAWTHIHTQNKNLNFHSYNLIICKFGASKKDKVNIDTHTGTCIYLHVCEVCVCMCVICVCTCMHTYIQTCINVHACMQHTYIHTYIQVSAIMLAIEAVRLDKSQANTPAKPNPRKTVGAN